MHAAAKVSKIKVQPSDEMLVEHSRGGNFEAFEELFTRHSGRVYEFCHHLTGDPDLSEKILLKTFFRFYKKLYRFHYRRKIIVELFDIAYELIDRAKSQVKASHFEAAGLEEMALWLLASKYGLSLGAVSTIVDITPGKLMDRYRTLDPKLSEMFDREGFYVLTADYRPVLRSKIDRYRSERHSLLTGLKILAAAGIILLLSWLAQSRLPSKISVPPADTVTVPLQRFVRERNPVFIRNEAFAEEVMEMIPGHGKVLGLDFEFFATQTIIDYEWTIREVDPKDYVALEFRLMGDPEMGPPKALFIHIKNGSTILYKHEISPISTQWKKFTVPLNRAEAGHADTIAFTLDRAHAGVKSGRFYIDGVGLIKKKD